MTVRLVALASGKGTNFDAIVRAIRDGTISRAEMVGLVVDRSSTGAERFAREAAVPVRLVDHASFASREEYDAAVMESVDAFAPDLIVAAGYMRILSDGFVQRYARRIMNIHPSLLPSFPGLHAQRQALEYGVKIAGCTVHFVDEGLDSGPVVVQRSVAIPEGATEGELADLIHREEHRAYVEAVRLFCAGEIQFDGRRVRIGRA